MPKIALLRHGQSEWNLANRFTGWVDVDLSPKGVEEAQNAGQKLFKAGYKFDKAYTSFQKRAIKTLNIVLEQMDVVWLPTTKSWKLNERHYGALQGLNKDDAIEKWGAEQVHVWRRSYDTRPPLLAAAHTEFDPSFYIAMGENEISLGESLADTEKRAVEFFTANMMIDLKQGKDILVSAHGNSLRSLIKFLEKLSPEQVEKVELATGEPVIYTLDYDLEILDKKILLKDL